MGWAPYIDKLKRGESVQFRPRGNSMAGKIESGQPWNVVPVSPANLNVSDVVPAVDRQTRRRCSSPVWLLIGLFGAGASAGVDGLPVGALRDGGRMKLLSKEVFLRHQNKRPPATGFVTYISTTRPVLMHCHGWQDYSDGYDDYSISVSHDNGKTWSA